MSFCKYVLVYLQNKSEFFYRGYQILINLKFDRASVILHMCCNNSHFSSNIISKPKSAGSLLKSQFTGEQSWWEVNCVVQGPALREPVRKLLLPNNEQHVREIRCMVHKRILQGRKEAWWTMSERGERLHVGQGLHHSRHMSPLLFSPLAINFDFLGSSLYFFRQMHHFSAS